MRTKVSGPESLELALVMKKKERLTIGYFLHSWFRHTRSFPWMCGGLIDRYSGVDHEYES